jgi:endonuclease/exonuclease/phosphatase family metal-dependent hydrolase
VADVRFGSFNVYNLHEPGRIVYDQALYTVAEYERKIAWLGSQVRAMRADVIGFQEVWSRAALAEAVVRSERFEDADVHMFDAGADPVEPNVALATRLRLLSPVRYHLAFPPTLSFGPLSAVQEFERPVLEAELELPAEGDLPPVPVRVFVAHLKSKRLTFLQGEDQGDPKVRALGAARSLLRRAAEATALRWLVVDQMRGTRTPVVVIGDLNDGIEAVTNRIITGERPFGKGADETAAAYDVMLYSTYLLQSQRNLRDVFYTHIHDFEYETLDHILVSEELVGRAPGSVAEFNGLQMWNDHLNVTDQTRSDHGQVVARFRRKA